ncbi:MAG TPA: ABC transporter permease, partial [Solirubrobacteraceae bacterium]|nr:ABC transporter permease [Solirubrobacteraceae bacterium]
PVVLYFVVTGPQRHAHFDGVAFPLYFMAGMATVGAMIAVISSGARIAADRSAGWTRQLRITPLTAGDYLGAKAACGFLMALLAIALVSLSGTALGVRLDAGEWLTMIGLMIVGLIPVAVLGILLGHVVTPDSLAPAVGGTITLLALLGGAYGFLVATSGAVYDLIKALPSYWLVQAGKTALGGSGWPAEGWIVIAAWTAVLAPLAVLAYRRDTARV